MNNIHKINPQRKWFSYIASLSDINLQKYILRVAGGHPDHRIKIDNSVLCSDRLADDVKTINNDLLNFAFKQAVLRHKSYQPN